jgi:hypothetical protein
MAESDDDRLRALRSRQHGGAYQEAPLPAAAQQKLAAAGAGRNIRGTGNSGAGPSRAVSEPAAKVDAKSGKHVINLNTAAEQDTQASIAKESAANAKVHLDPRAPQSPLYNKSAPASAPGKAGLGAATSSDTEWESQVKSVSSHIKENHPHGGIGGIAVEYSKAGEPKPLSKDKITDLAERHLMGSARVPGLKAKSHEAAGEGERASDQPGLRVKPSDAAQSNAALKELPSSSASLTTGNEGKTPIPANYKGKTRTPAKTATAPVAASARTPRDFSGMTDKSSAESRSGRRLERNAQYSESSDGQSRRDHYAANAPASNVTGSKTAQDVLHTERLSSPINHGQFGKTARDITSAVHSGLASQPVKSPAARPVKISDSVREARGSSTSSAPTHQQKVDSQLEHGLITPDEHRVQSAGQVDHPLHPKSNSVVQGSVVHDEVPAKSAPAKEETPAMGGQQFARSLGSQGSLNRTGIETSKPKMGKDITYFGATGAPKAPEEGKRGAPAYNTQQSYQKHISGGGTPESYWQERDAKKAAPKTAKSLPAPAPVTEAPKAPETAGLTSVVLVPTPSPKTEVKAPAPAVSQTSNRRPSAPSAPFPASDDLDRNETFHLAKKTAPQSSGVPGGSSGAGSSYQNPQLGQRALSQSAVRPTTSTAKTIPLEQGSSPSRTRSPRGTSGNVPSPVAQSGQFSGEHHYHFHGNVNMGAGTQINGNVGDGASVSGGVEHGSMPRAGSGTGGGGRRSSGSGKSPRGPVTGSPTGLQRLAYGAIHTSVNGHSIAGGVEHITGGGHLGMNDSAGKPIGHPHDEYVRHHEMNAAHGTQHGQVNSSQFGQARASRQQATPATP